MEEEGGPVHHILLRTVYETTTTFLTTIVGTIVIKTVACDASLPSENFLEPKLIFDLCVQIKVDKKLFRVATEAHKTLVEKTYFSPKCIKNNSLFQLTVSLSHLL